MPFVKEAALHHLTVGGHLQKVFLVEFHQPLEVLTTLEGFKRVKAVGNVNLHHSLWEEEWTMDSLTATVAGILGREPGDGAFLFTGVNMDNIAFSTRRFRDLAVWVAVTAGRGNAMRAGVDEGRYLQKGNKWEDVGTVNIMVFVNRVMTRGAMVNAIIRITEAKTGVFEDLGIRSAYTPHVQATGTGTDNVLVAAWGTSGEVFSSAGGHTKLGELVARGVREGVLEAFHKHDGLRLSDPSLPGRE